MGVNNFCLGTAYFKAGAGVIAGRCPKFKTVIKEAQSTELLSLQNAYRYVFRFNKMLQNLLST